MVSQTELPPHQQDDYGAEWIPRPAEIAAECRKIQEGWSPEETRYRARCCRFHLTRREVAELDELSVVPAVADPVG